MGTRGEWWELEGNDGNKKEGIRTWMIMLGMGFKGGGGIGENENGTGGKDWGVMGMGEKG